MALENVKVGDFLLEHSYSSNRLVRVEKVTKTWVFVSFGKRAHPYRKTDGYAVGHNSSAYSASFCTIPTKRQVEKIKRATLTKKLCSEILEHLSKKPVSYETLLKLKQILDNEPDT